jgi:phospholipid/cholesterol/gamma-HCH transport system ATP-binding protein
MIKIVDLYKSYNNKQILNGVNLEIFDGEVISIMGGSGGGKTQLLRHIVGLTKPDKGHVFVDDVDITKLNEHDLNEQQKRFGYLFQGAALFDSLTAEENVSFGLRNMKLTEEEIKKKTDWCLSHVGLVNVNKQKPAELSGGMKNRVGLARAIARDPKYMLYDEPITGLDPIVADTINDLIIYLNQTLKMTSVIVTHDIASAYKVSHRIAMLYQGKIIELGTPDEIRNTKNEYVQKFITACR